jgi:hypothetical protein
LFLGGACALRREAYDSVGGYFTELFYGHEELELSWRLIDAGWMIEYLDDVRVTHPKTDISRHSGRVAPDGTKSCLDCSTDTPVADRVRSRINVARRRNDSGRHVELADAPT